MNREKNREQLEKVPYIPILDLAICFYYAFDEAGVDNGMIPIYRSHLDNWKVTDRELLEIAVKNTPRLFPGETIPMEEVLGDALQELPEEVRREFLRKVSMMILTNSRKTYGACSILYPGMLEQVYDGRFFPCYYYGPNVITVAVTSKAEPEDTEHITWLFLPMVQEEIDRALLRGGITDPADVRLRLEDSQLPNEVDVLLDMEYETLSDLNELAEATDGLSKADMEKLGAVVILAEPKSAAQIKNLAESLDLFDFAPGAHTPQEYGKYMIQQSGRFEYDENLDAFYDYEKYGTERMNEEDGMFTDRGYVAYKGYTSMEEVMNGSQSSHMEMGGMM